MIGEFPEAGTIVAAHRHGSARCASDTGDGDLDVGEALPVGLFALRCHVAGSATLAAASAAPYDRPACWSAGFGLVCVII
jgi:hypothetical protein